MIYFSNQPLCCFCYFFWAKLSLKDPEIDFKRLLTEDDIRIQMYFNLRAVREDLRLIDKPTFADVPPDANATDLVADILCYDGDDLYANIKEFSELFPHLNEHYTESLTVIKEKLNSSLACHNEMNKDEKSWYRPSWPGAGQRASGEKLYVPNTDVTTRTVKLIRNFLDPNTITV